MPTTQAEIRLPTQELRDDIPFFTKVLGMRMEMIYPADDPAIAQRLGTARDILREAPGIMVIDKREDGGYVTPVECVGDFATFISRIRQDSTIDNGLNLWCVSDNLRKGAALNAVQIAETLGNRVLRKG